jgi:hypothetical protein
LASFSVGNSTDELRVPAIRAKVSDDVAQMTQLGGQMRVLGFDAGEQPHALSGAREGLGGADEPLAIGFATNVEGCDAAS